MDTDFDFKALGKRIKEARIAKDWTQADLAAKANMSTSHISSIERGNSEFSVRYLALLVNALDMPVGKVLYDELTSSEIGEKLISDIICDCEPWEVRFLADCMAALKDSIQKNKIAPIEP